MAILRSLAFYIAFYIGTFYYVTTSLIAVIFSRDAFRSQVHGWSRWHRRCVTGLLGIELKMEGAPLDEPVLYAVKHESFFEAIDTTALFRLPAVFAKQELFEIPGWGRTAAIYGLIAVEREAGARALRAMITEARKRVSQGRPLVIFPEGTRVAAGTTPPLRAGFAGLYKLVGLPVVPVAVDSGRLYRHLIKKRGTITYKFGEPIPPGLPREEVEARVHAAINALNG
ncbi:lysophospholipid acyltransferase family protein [Altererythrobacter sp. MF3-039]|uniref:lysophospholipid acyltransferase family protein n=1 Tax=Altererythrobacter sp. MF3-039 TaxID=3252901 RepID=UPI00390C97E5